MNTWNRLFYGWVLFEIRVSMIKIDNKPKTLVVMNMINEIVGKTIVAHHRLRCHNSEIVTPSPSPEDINKYLSVV